MIPLRKSTASQEVLLGPFLDDTDGKTAEIGLTIANTDIKLWKRGGTTETNKNSGGATHIASGRYYATLDATDTDTTGEMIINVAVAGALPVRLVCHVYEAAVFDAFFAASAGGYQVPIWSSASATVNLSGTTVKAVTDAVVLPSSASINITGNITGNLSGSVGSVTGAVGSVTGNVGGSVASVTGAVGSVTGNVGGSVASVVGNVGGNVTGSVGSVATDGITSSSFAAGAITANSIAASALNGKGDWQTVIWTSASSTVNLSGTTIKAVTDAVTLPSSASINITGNITGNLSGSVGSVTGSVGSVVAGVTVATNNDKTGYSLTQTFPTNFASLAITAGGAVTAGTVSDKTGYSLAQTFPTNFSMLGINGSGHISRVTLVDTTTVNSDMRGTDGAALASVWTSTVAGRIDMPLSDLPTAGENADAVWDEAMSGHTTSGTYGGRIVRATNSNVTVQITGNYHVAADIHELQPGVIAAADFAAGAIDAAALAADAAAEIASAVRTNLATELARLDVTVGSRLADASYTAPLTAASTRSALGLAAANLDSQLDALPTAIENADALLGRSVATSQSTAAEWSLCTLVLAALESTIAGSTWTIYRTDGTTVHATKTVTTDAAADPVTGVS